MSFEAILSLCARDTEALLDKLLAIGEAGSPHLVVAMRYAVLGPAKRLRPFFVIESAGLFGVPRDRSLRVGAALECIHCYSLVHDDLPAMDDDDLRRGRPTVHRAFDEATAILAGDALQTLAFEFIAGPATHPDGGIRSALVSQLAKAAGMAGMAGGQMLDIEADGNIERMQSLKTGALFRFACESGAILGGADPAPLRQYAEHIGLAFQIADDILDVESTPETLGKATRKDAGRGKVTFVERLGLEGAKEKANDLVVEAISALDVYGPTAASLRDAARYVVSRRK